MLFRNSLRVWSIVHLVNRNDTTFTGFWFSAYKIARRMSSRKGKAEIFRLHFMKKVSYNKLNGMIILIALILES